MSLRYSIASAVQGTSAPPIPKARSWATSYTSNPTSGPLLDLSQGVPGSAPHPDLLRSLTEAASDPETAKYGPILGEPSLRSSVASEICNQYQLKDGDVRSEDIGITAGCNMALMIILMALCPPSSSILLPCPSYFNYSMSLSMLSINPVYMGCDPDEGFLSDLEKTREFLSRTSPDGQAEDDSSENTSGETSDARKIKRPRLILLVSPSNPTGTVMSPDLLKKWYDLAREYKLALILDETYRDFVEHERGGRGIPHDLFKESDWRETLISVGSFSKSYRIPGYRLGSIIASPSLLNHVATICDCMQICPPRIAQKALSPLLPQLRSDLLSSSQALSHRRHLFETIIKSVKGWKVESIGGYFAYVSFPQEFVHNSSALGLKRKKLGSEDIAKEMGKRVGLVVLPGCYFMPDLEDDDAWKEVLGGQDLREDRWLRFAVANVDDEAINQVGPRLEEFNKIMGLS